jgi:hypothetical protein
MSLKHQAQNKLRAYYQRYTLSAKEKNRRAEERRVQEVFGNDTIQIRFDNLIKEWQVWCDTPNTGLYCICNLGPTLEAAEAIYILRGRQMGKRETLAMLEQHQIENEHRMNTKIEEIAREMAEGVYSQAKGKVTLSWSD